MPDETLSPVQGQETQTPAPQDTPAGPFYEDVLPDGSKRSFASKDELAKELKNSYLRQSDYTKKTQELASLRKKDEEGRKKFEEDQKAFLEMRKKYDDWDKALKTRPDLYSQLERMAQGPVDPASLLPQAREYTDSASKELAQRLEALEKSMEEDRTRRELDGLMTSFKGKYDDFDESDVMARLEYLSDGSTEKLMDVLYWAAKGQKSPAEIEAKMADNLKKKAQANLTPTKGGGIATSKEKYSTTGAAAKAARADFGIPE